MSSSVTISHNEIDPKSVETELTQLISNEINGIFPRIVSFVSNPYFKPNYNLQEYQENDPKSHRNALFILDKNFMGGYDCSLLFGKIMNYPGAGIVFSVMFKTVNINIVDASTQQQKDSLVKSILSKRNSSLLLFKSQKAVDYSSTYDIQVNITVNNGTGYLDISTINNDNYKDLITELQNNQLNGNSADVYNSEYFTKELLYPFFILCYCILNKFGEQMKSFFEGGYTSSKINFDPKKMLEIQTANGLANSILRSERERKAVFFPNTSNIKTQNSQKNGTVPVEINASELINIQSFSNGGMSDIFKAKYKTADVIIKKPKYEKDATIDFVINNMSREIALLMNLNHPNIAEILGYYFDDHVQSSTNKKKIPYMVQRYYNSDMGTFFSQSSSRTIDHLLKAAIDISRALGYVHSEKILHLDIKPENVFVEISSSGQVDFLLADFGVSVFGGDNSKYSDMRGNTPGYRAPEMIISGHIGPHSDIYSFGMTLYSVIVPGTIPPLSLRQELLESFQNADAQKQNEFMKQVNKEVFSIEFTPTLEKEIEVEEIITVYSEFYYLFNPDDLELNNTHFKNFSASITDTQSSLFKEIIKEMLRIDYNKRPTISKILRTLTYFP